jgi:hypothetical protein
MIQVFLRATWAVWQLKIMQGVLLTLKENVRVVEHIFVMHSVPCSTDITDNVTKKGHKKLSITTALYFSHVQVSAYVAIFGETALNIMQRYLCPYNGKRSSNPCTGLLQTLSIPIH